MMIEKSKNLEHKKYCREYYQKHKKERIISMLKIQKANGYISEKSEKQRSLRKIKRRTRYHFPLYKCLKCEFCNYGATEHHHNTFPIKFNKFNFVCHSCHTQLNLKMGV
jgi:hypothetical protein